MMSLKITTKTKKVKVDNKVCDALRCNFIPSVKINLDCKEHGTLTIFVCKSCSSKFGGI
ncbi:hypothetical protein [Candidatus Nitrosocosmicus sp. SS]|uniref:hypothetical protein n=1 Tax=Candidatus Nitrosocosmicus agrestis TaxID=2563600 RepID=UPI0012B51F16|nr:hypothetical protein [Candidatus Nitrosocosmicus sp. SS]